MSKYDLDYPEHKHPHGIDKPENPQRIWVCEECLHLFTDSEIRLDETGQWAHLCKSHPCKKGKRCESHLESYIPDIAT